MATGSGFGGVGAILEGKRSDEDDYFKVLGCTETSTAEQITAEYRVLAMKCHPDKHPGDEQALQQFQRLQEAKDTLLDPEKRQKYDKWRQSEMCISYKQWLGMSNRCATTMHWAKPKDQTMLESCSDHHRKKAAEQFQEEAASSSSSSANVIWNANSATPQQPQSGGDNVWRPDKTTSIYSKFRNYKI